MMEVGGCILRVISEVHNAPFTHSHGVMMPSLFLRAAEEWRPESGSE